MIQAERIIWDLPTRMFHWTIAASVILNLFVLEEGEDGHQWVGYIAVSTVTLRLLWGFVGGAASRLSALPIHPRSVLSFVRDRFSDPLGKYVGHNPLASLVYIVIWSCIFALAITGWMMDLDAFWDAEWLEELHGLISIALQIFIGIHLTGVFLDSLRYRRRTWAAMVTGRRR